MSGHLVANLVVPGTAQEVHCRVCCRDRLFIPTVVGDGEDAGRVLDEVVSTERLFPPMEQQLFEDPYNAR
jgi:hypothetical protein